MPGYSHRTLLYTFLCLTASLTSFAKTTDSEEKLSVYITQERLTKQDVAQNSVQWKRYDKTAKEAIQGIFWAKIDLKNKSSTDEVKYLYLDDIQKVELFLLKNGKLQFLGKTGTLIPLSERSFPDGKIIHSVGNSVQHKITLPPGEATVFLKINQPFEKLFVADFALYTVPEWTEEVLPTCSNKIAIQWLVAGALLMISVYHLLIYFSRKDKTYLHYAIYTGLFFFVILNESGVGQLFLFVDYAYVHKLLKETQILSILVGLCYFVFMRSFIDLPRLLPRLDRVINRVLSIIIPVISFSVIMYAFTLQRQWFFPQFITAAVYYILAFVSLYFIFKSKDRLADYFSFGSVALYVAVLCNAFFSVLIHIGTIPEATFDRVYIIEIGVIAEIIVFSLGLGYRMQIQQEEKNQIENLNRLQTKFFTNISHEFRTPLTIISGITEQIKGHKKEKSLIRRNSKSLLKLINQLLDLSKLNSGNSQLNIIQSDAIPFLRYLTESFYSMATDKGVRLTFYSEIDSVMMDFDESSLQQIVFNLVNNAIKFTNKGGKVILHVNRTTINRQHFLQIKIKDTGIGISEKTSNLCSSGFTSLKTRRY